MIEYETLSEKSASELEVETLRAENRDLKEKNEALAAEVEKWKKAATIDVLTQIENRRGLSEKMDEIRAGNEQRVDGGKEHEYAVLILDIDNFKIVNDAWSHDVGDAVLRESAKFLRGKFRGSDIVARYGGEEFIVVLRKATAQDAINKLFDQTEKRARLGFEVNVGTEEDPDMVPVTFSGGVTTFKDGEDFFAAIAHADEALVHIAKPTGRDRIVMAEAKTSTL